MLHRKIKRRIGFLCLMSGFIGGCSLFPSAEPQKPELRVAGNHRYLEYQNGTPFFWLGGTAWGMSEWFTREEVDLYFDNRKAKGFSLVQICLFWGKREEDPVQFSVNPPNIYGFQAFEEVDGFPDAFHPAVVQEGSPTDPNDYWDHVEYILLAARNRGMMVGVLPVWGRRYVNASHKNFSASVFSEEGMRLYGKFLGERFGAYSNIVWVLGGDVKADANGNFLNHYRRMAEGITEGISGQKIAWNESSPWWDYSLMTYHPDGAPMVNSSAWFHEDKWLDFNMIETFQFRDNVYAAVSQDYRLSEPVKPTVLGEPAYEGLLNRGRVTEGIHMRRQAWQTLMAGGAGFTYGGARDSLGNGPLFSPFKGWQQLLDQEGSVSMKLVRNISLTHNWPHWEPSEELILNGQGEGEFRAVAVQTRIHTEWLVYFPENRSLQLGLKSPGTLAWQWCNPATGEYLPEDKVKSEANPLEFTPPETMKDALLILKLVRE